MTPSRLSRVMGGGRLSVGNCLGLADLLDEYPHVVLRAYGYAQEAAILERAYPQTGGSRQSSAGESAAAFAREAVMTWPSRSTRRASGLVAALALGGGAAPCAKFEGDPRRRTRAASFVHVG